MLDELVELAELLVREEVVLKPRDVFVAKECLPLGRWDVRKINGRMAAGKAQILGDICFKGMSLDISLSPFVIDFKVHEKLSI